MEHGITSLKTILAILTAACVLLAPVMALAHEQRIVIVTGEGSKIKAISAKNVRRAYLGAIIVQDGIEINPLRNQSDKLAEEVFLQKIMFMSAEAYERQLLAHTFRGGNILKAYDKFNDLLSVLQNDSTTITFMLFGTAMTTPGIKIIGDL
jgi:hypothetical protein